MRRFVSSLSSILLMVSQAGAIAISGTVSTAVTNKPIGFATIRVAETDQTLMANASGEYRIDLPAGRYHLKFSHISFYSQTTEITVADSAQRYDVSLRPAVIKLGAIEVYDRAYDPAQRIILKAIKHKEDILSRIRDYQFEAYTKLVVRQFKSDDSTEIWMITESMVQSRWERPDKYKEIITGRKQTANLNPESYLVSMGEILNFNRNRLDMGAQMVVSPTASDALDHYNYYLLDSLYIDDRVVFRLEVEPKSNIEPLFVGTIDIMDSSFAVVGVDVGFGEGFETSVLSDSRYKQRFARFRDEYWMPIEIRFDGKADVGIPGIPRMAFEYTASLYQYDINDDPEDDIFDEYALEVAEGADEVDSSFWQSQQVIPLTREELDSYRRIDSVKNLPRSALSRAGHLIRSKISSVLFDESAFHFNRVEGAYLGSSFYFDDFSDRVALSIQSGYALDGHQWQHRYGLAFSLHKRRRIRLKLEYRDQVVPRKNFSFERRRNVTRAAISNKTDPYDYYLEKGFSVGLGTKIFGKGRAGVRLYDYQQYSLENSTEFNLFRKSKKHRLNPTINDGHLRGVSLSFRYDSRKAIKWGKSDFKLITANYTKLNAGMEYSSPDLLDSDFHYRKFDLMLFRRQRILNLGLSSIVLAGGFSELTLPSQRFFSVHRTASLFTGLLDFKTLGEINFYGDRTAYAYWAHDFGRLLFKLSRLPVIRNIPFSLLIYGGAFWTDYNNVRPTTNGGPPGDNASSLDFTYQTSAPTAYTELGVGLGRITILDLKAFFTWQRSSYATHRFSFTVGASF